MKEKPEYFFYERATQDAKAVICLVHGIGEHSARYHHLAEYFNQAGFAFTAVDLPGHGQSGGKRGDIASFDDFYQAIDFLLAESANLYPDKDLVLYGHSMGGLISLAYLLKQKPTSIKKTIITSPWLKLQNPPPKAMLAFAKFMDKVLPHLILKSGLDARDICREKNVVDAYVNDPLVHDKISVRLFVDAIKAVDYVHENIGQLQIPLFMAHGTADKICSYEASKQFASQNKRLIQFETFKDCYHEIHNEKNQQELFNAIIYFLK